MSAATASAPAGYAWEATDDQVSERYGVELSAIVRFDLNTSPAPPDVALRALRSGAYGRPISEYPPSDYRDLIAAAADVYGVGRDELLVGAGADEVLDLVAKAFLRPGLRAVIPTPTYAMYAILTEQRPAQSIAVPRATRPSSGSAARTTRRGCLSRSARSRNSCASLPPMPSPLADPHRSWSSTRRTPSSSAPRSSICATPTRASSSSGPPRKPMRSPGSASGSPSRAPS